MNKLVKLFITSISAITLALVSFSSSFAKVEGDYIVLGSAISLTGKYSSNGVHTQNGYNMAVERINKMGGVNVGGKSYKFEIIYYDDESNPKRAAQLAERLIKQDGVHYMLGPYSSGLTKAIAPVTEKYKIPMVEANGASRSLFTKGYKYLFAVLSPANQYLEVAIDLAVEKNATEIKKTFSDVEIIKWGEIIDFDIIINATSVGLDKADVIKLDYEKISKDKFFYDVIYNPKETNFLKEAKRFGGKTENGKTMFLYQAQKAFFIWHGVLPKIDTEAINLLNL